MCHLCQRGFRPSFSPSRRHFFKAGVAASLGVLASPSVFAQGPPAGHLPGDTGRPGRRYVIRGGAVMSMDPAVGDFQRADVLVEGKKIVAVGPHITAGDASVIDARGRIVMPGFVDTHHHQFETALRSFLADGLLANDGTPHGAVNYFDYILGKFARVYRPQDVYINELVGSLSQLDAGVTAVHDVSQIHHSPEHSDAAIKGLADSGRRTAFGYFEGHGDKTKYPDDAARIKKRYFSSDDQLITMIMGGEIYLPGYEKAWTIGRDLNIPIAAHVVGTLGIAETFDKLAAAGQFKSDLLFIHMTGISDAGWKATKDAGAGVSIAFPIEMTMRHGMPPILKTLEMGIQPSLSVDVECTMTADFFTQMRSAMTLQRALANEMAIAKKDTPDLLTSRDVLRFATIQGARDLKIDRKAGSLTPGKEADILVLDATAINVAPLNHVPGAVVTLMERSNVETVIVAGRVRKWKGRLLNANLARLRTELEASRDYLFKAAGVTQDRFRK
jgi:cytosine/adenosine deaminase-related metal-dependent hydrolase